MDDLIPSDMLAPTLAVIVPSRGPEREGTSSFGVFSRMRSWALARSRSWILRRHAARTDRRRQAC